MSVYPERQERLLPQEAPFTSDPLSRDLEETHQEWYRDLVEHSEDLLCTHDLQGRLLTINPVPARVLGYSVEEMLQKPMQDFIDPRFRDQFADYLREIERAGKAHGLLAVVTRSGERRIWEYHNTLRTEGVPAAVVRGIAHDVTERVRAERALRESNEQLTQAARERERVLRELSLFRALIDQSNDGIEVLDPETLRILDVNERTCLDLGYTREELLSMTARDIDPAIDGSVRDEVQRQLGDSGSATLQRVHRKKDGTTFPVEVTLRRVRLDRAYDVALSRNLTWRKQAQEKLRASEERLRLALEATRVGTFERNLQTGASRWSPEMEAIYGLAPGAFPKSIEAFVELVYREDRQSVARLVEQSMQIGDAEGEWRVIWPDGTVHWIAGRWRVFKDEHGRPARVLGVDFDITERKRTEEALRQSEERFRVALKNAPIAVFNQDRDLRYTWISSKLPWSGIETLGKTVFDVFNQEGAARITEVRRRVLETGVGARDQVQVTCRGKKYYLDTTIEPVRDASGAVIGLTGASMDVTDLREVTEALREAQKKLTEEKLYLEQEINTELGFGEIIGQSQELQAVMEQVGKVAPSDSTVLLLGETGTGKELVARATHRLSQRSGNSFIKMNCAAIPSGLLESELFGHEKGAFTGAVSRKIGRLELADQGTLFLDEIGEIPLALQPKLLRVLQDKEFERLGGTKTLKVDFRLIAATNRDLADRVPEKEFRSDLYYRLNVFPIRVPPLRQRREDIRLLVEHFVQKFARRMNKSITSIPKTTIDELTRWDWPGNVRELENFIERSVILTNGSVLVSPLSELRPITAENKGMDQTLETAERAHILRALWESRGQIGGRHGAAARLGLKRTTLQSKLKQLGINPRTPAA